MIPKIQEKIERETERIRKEMNRQGSPLEFIFEGKTPKVTGIVANSDDYPLLSRQGYRIETTRRRVEEESFDWDKRWSDHYSELESKDVFYIPGIKCCGSGDEHVPAVLNVYCEVMHNNWSSSDERTTVHRLEEVPLRRYMARLEGSSDITEIISAEILREIIVRGK